MVAKIRFQPESKTVLGMRNSLNDTHTYLGVYQECLINDFLRFMKKNREKLTFRRLLAEARECFGRYSDDIRDLNPKLHSEAEGKDLLEKLLIQMRINYQQQHQQQPLENP